MSKDLRQLLERIQLRLDESFVGIGSEVADLPAADLAELLNQLRLSEAAAIVSMLAPPIPCSSKTRAAASNSFSRVSSRVGLVRTLDIRPF